MSLTEESSELNVLFVIVFEVVIEVELEWKPSTIFVDVSFGIIFIGILERLVDSDDVTSIIGESVILSARSSLLLGSKSRSKCGSNGITKGKEGDEGEEGGEESGEEVVESGESEVGDGGEEDDDDGKVVIG